MGLLDSEIFGTEETRGNAPLGLAIKKLFSGRTVKTPTDGKKPSGSIFGTKALRDNSPGGKFFDKGGKGAFLKEGVEDTGPALLASLASSLNDNRLRNIQGDLAVTETATAPFSKGSITGLFAGGPGGVDLNADIAEAFTLDEKRRERNKDEELRDSLFSLLDDNKNLKLAQIEALLNKTKKR